MLKTKIVEIVNKHPGISFFDLFNKLAIDETEDFVIEYSKLAKDNKIRVLFTQDSVNGSLNHFTFPATYNFYRGKPKW